MTVNPFRVTVEDAAIQGRDAVERQSRAERNPRLPVTRRRMGTPHRVADEDRKAYRVDNVRTRVLSPDEITLLLTSCPPTLALIAKTT